MLVACSLKEVQTFFIQFSPQYKLGLFSVWSNAHMADIEYLQGIFSPIFVAEDLSGYLTDLSFFFNKTAWHLTSYIDEIVVYYPLGMGLQFHKNIYFQKFFYVIQDYLNNKSCLGVLMLFLLIMQIVFYYKILPALFFFVWDR